MGGGSAGVLPQVLAMVLTALEHIKCQQYYIKSLSKKCKIQNFPGSYTTSRIHLHNSVASKDPAAFFYHQTHVWIFKNINYRSR